MEMLKILIADDEELVRDLYEMILESELSCEIVKTENGNEAIAALKANADFDFIVSDYNMPHANGGVLYLYNKSNNKVPFFLISGGDVTDYSEFSDFKTSNSFNHFFTKPFNSDDIIAASKIIQSKKQSSDKLAGENLDLSRYIKIRLVHYLQYANSAAEVFIKLSNDKYTKIITAGVENVAEIDLLKHYQAKGIESVYIERIHYSSLMQDVFKFFMGKIAGEKKAETTYEVAGLPLSVSFEGLKDIGISEVQIEKTNGVIEDSVRNMFRDSNSEKQLKNLCEDKGFAMGHSILIVYVAGRICLETNLVFSSSMKKICTAAFYHDYSLFEDGIEIDGELDHNSLDEHTDRVMLKALLNHPTLSAASLPANVDLAEDTRRIILEHHEMPDGSGYPRKLTASQIAPLSCLFIVAQQITFCLLRNNYSMDRLRDFLKNSEATYNQGNFSKFYTAAKTVFAEKA